ncbi:(d)CMP kinase [Thermocrinis minervae]|uniref:Cytidylate kinase n=1 Tax=Thermocrinis minervae TaxID=381751 RepID=A0A1M6QGH2_9AQUI|nr:(d)CMP kinase [Thermocrinis minervae]SHK19265.1 cytidylate kinase [Thermocrinis minervae]
MKIAVDGPAASGKSSVARELSKILNLPYLETGKVYRLFAYIASQNKVKYPLSLFNEDFDVVFDIGITRVFYRGKELSEELYTEEVSTEASKLASLPELREKMIEFFRALVGQRQVVAEGRDVGTHIFPNADIKFFITADPRERARRRYKDLVSKGIKVTYEEVLKSIVERDKRDSERPLYPFRPAEDAIIVDTTNKTLEEVVKEILSYILQKHEAEGTI